MSNIAVSPAQPTGMTLSDIRVYLLADGRSAEDTDNLIRKNGIELEQLDDDSIISLEVCWRIFLEHTVIVEDEMHGLARRRVKPGVTSLLVGRMLLCETLYDALAAFCASHELIVPSLKISLVRRGDSVSMRWNFPGRNTELHQIALECTVVTYHTIFAWLIDQPLPVLRVSAPEGRKNSASTLLRALNAPVIYSGEGLEVQIPKAASESPIKQVDIRQWQDGVYKILCAAAMEPREQEVTGQFTNKVRSALLHGLGQKQIAAKWGLSTKTISRRLAQEGYSFRRLRDDIRMEKAASLIHAGLSVEEIGYLVGYEDPRSFRRAFVRWFGLSPSVYRAHRASKEESTLPIEDTRA